MRPDAREAQALWGAVLDGGVSDLELGALVASLTVAGESVDELLGLWRAITTRCARMRPRPDLRAISIPVYGLVPGEASFAALLALLLRRFGVPVIVHGCLESAGERSAAVLLRELGVLPCASIAEAEHRLQADGIVFVPAQLLSPPFATALSLRARLGAPNSAHLAAMALDPGGTGAVRLVTVVPGTPTQGLPAFLAVTDGDALVLTWPAGESPANIALLPRVARLSRGCEWVVFESDAVHRPPLAIPLGVAEAAAWIREVIGRHAPVPVPLVKLAAVCLHASGVAPDISQAKAIVALQAGRLAA
jgi:anthranilate phosphoribosyltransferase